MNKHIHEHEACQQETPAKIQTLSESIGVLKAPTENTNIQVDSKGVNNHVTKLTQPSDITLGPQIFVPSNWNSACWMVSHL